jgi:hypothetical protein
MAILGGHPLRIFEMITTMCTPCWGIFVRSVCYLLLVSCWILLFSVDVERFDFLPSYQSGFRTGRGTFDQLVCVQQQVIVLFAHRESLVFVKLDMQKAYDRVWRAGLMERLRCIGVGGKMYSWVRSFLCDRRAGIILEGVSSGWREYKSGVPPGSPLSPLLFNIFTAPMLRRRTFLSEWNHHHHHHYHHHNHRTTTTTTAHTHTYTHTRTRTHTHFLVGDFIHSAYRFDVNKLSVAMKRRFQNQYNGGILRSRCRGQQLPRG